MSTEAHGLMPRRARKKSYPRFAICVENSEYPVSLELHKAYRMLYDKEAANEGYLRIIDESGEDYLHPADFFVVISVSRETTRALSRSFARKVSHVSR